MKFQAGVDEAGRGCLAGIVVAGAVILDPHQDIQNLCDSKLLSAKKREQLFLDIRKKSIAWAVGWSSVREISDLNILQASLLAMQRAVKNLNRPLEKIWVDGNQLPKFQIPAQAVIDGDALIPAISAASIVAKVVRDRYMQRLEKKFPGYGFAKHKGYGTKAHLMALQTLGICSAHRPTFLPVKLASQQFEIA